MELQIKTKPDNEGNLVVHLVNRDEVAEWVQQEVSRELKKRAKAQRREPTKVELQEITIATNAVPSRFTITTDDHPDLAKTPTAALDETIVNAVFTARRPAKIRVVRVK